MPSVRIWFVTGASTGFGRLLTEHALTKGDKVVATLRRPEVLADLSARHKEQLLVLKLDVTDKDAVTAAFDKAKEAFGRVDVVFNNAGTVHVGEVEGLTDKSARDQFEVNFWGATYVAKEAIKTFREFNKPIGGKILHVDSSFAFDPAPACGHYSASKAAGDALMEALSRELDPAWNIKIVNIVPGAFKTPMTSNIVPEPIHPAYIDNPNLASRQVRAMMDQPFGANPAKLVKAIYEISLLEGDAVELRVPIGADCIVAFEKKAKALQVQVEKGRKWSEDLGFD